MSTTPLAQKISKRAHGWFRRRRSVDAASFHMLQLYRSNLEVRLRCIDDRALTSECHKRIYAELRQTIKAWEDNGAGDRDRQWDEAYKVERLMAVLLTGGQLRQEIDARLCDLAAERVPDAAWLKSEYETLIKPAHGVPPGMMRRCSRSCSGSSKHFTGRPRRSTSLGRFARKQQKFSLPESWSHSC